ncbi:MAG: hypothetical protein KKD94_01195, partial [Nanoarchaeota archaeon]|nr:hypothetical protein [Nanoarchaeota archaeon]
KEKEFGELVKEVPRLVDNYFRHITPLSVKKDKGGKRYKVKVNCPFCKKNIEYGNYNLQKRLLYRRVIYCRECGMRFVVVSSLMKLSGSFPYLKSRSEKAIRKIRSTMSVRNIK